VRLILFLLFFTWYLGGLPLGWRILTGECVGGLLLW
jgi:hypothetical protein